MNYTLETSKAPGKTSTLTAGVKRFLPLMKPEMRLVIVAIAAMLTSTCTALLGPIIIARGIDRFVGSKDNHGLAMAALVLMAIYLVGVLSSYTQIRTMGGVGRRVLFSLRNTLLSKLQDLPVAFFNQNKAGDLISRLNNDTDKLNQFVGQALMQFLSSLFVMTGVAFFAISLNFRLGIAALLPAAAVLSVTKATAAWVKARNLRSLQSVGGMSSEIQQSLENFKVIVAFNRKDYFQSKFETANEANYQAAVSAGYASNVFMPMYGLANHLAQLLVVAYGIVLIRAGESTAGELIGFLLYVNSFYGPMRQLATVWSSFQLALAALDRISEVLALESDMEVLSDTRTAGPCALLSNAPAAPPAAPVLEFRSVYFQYPGGKEVLRDVSFTLEKGKAYALVGPTGGGKTTTASLMARLYDPSNGAVFLDGRDIRSVPPEDRSRKIGFIPQEPFLFTGTVGDNIVYGNEEYENHSSLQLAEVLHNTGLSTLLARFPEGLDTKVANTGNSISLGQKQLIAFMRATLRRPEVLILDEATANIDTVTEHLLEEILDKLPQDTTKVIIAHRLNTIDNVDQIYFVNSGGVALAGSMEHALDMLLHGKRES